MGHLNNLQSGCLARLPWMLVTSAGAVCIFAYTVIILDKILVVKCFNKINGLTTDIFSGSMSV